MPIITVQFIKDVVATPEQKRELIVGLTDKFVEILGDVVRPFVYCLIQETPQQEWGIAGVPMPDLVYLTSEQHAGVIGRSNDIMRSVVQSVQQPSNSKPKATAFRAEWADAIWRGEAMPETAAESAEELADAIWRGEYTPNDKPTRSVSAQDARADAIWRSEVTPSVNGYHNGATHSAAHADAIWRGEITPSTNGHLNSAVSPAQTADAIWRGQHA